MAAGPLGVDEFKLETTFGSGGIVVHTSLKERPAFPFPFLQLYWKTKVRSRWKRVGQIGSGGFGKVWLQENESGDKRAVKGVKRQRLKDASVDISRELQLLAELREHNEYFVEFLGWYEDQKYIYIAMEYMERGDLAQYLIESGSEAKAQAREITKQLLEGIMILHARKICHRDLKPQNILITSATPILVKIADFGVSKREAGTSLHTAAGTDGYKAPEVMGLVKREHRLQDSYTNAVDMWALGCLVHEVLTSERPFLQAPPSNPYVPDESGFGPPRPPTPGIDLLALSEFCSSNSTFRGIALLSQRSAIGGKAIDFVRGLLVANPEARMPPPIALRHPWLLGDTGDDLENSDDDLDQTALEDFLQIPVEAPDAHDAELPKVEFEAGDTLKMHNDIELTLEYCESRLRGHIRSERRGLVNLFPGDLSPFAREARRASNILLETTGMMKEIALDLSVLVLYDLVLLIDDGKSMNLNANRARMKLLHNLVDTIVKTYSLVNEGGVKSIKFLNHRHGQDQVKEGMVGEVLTRSAFHGPSRLGTELYKKILSPLVLGTTTEPIVIQKPLLVMIITDGYVEGERDGLLEEVIIRTIATLKQSSVQEPNAVAFQFLGIGDDPNATKRLKSLDDHHQVGNFIDFYQVDSALFENSERNPEMFTDYARILLGAIIPYWGDYDGPLEFEDLQLAPGPGFEMSDEDYEDDEDDEDE